MWDWVEDEREKNPPPPNPSKTLSFSISDTVFTSSTHRGIELDTTDITIRSSAIIPFSILSDKLK